MLPAVLCRSKQSPPPPGALLPPDTPMADAPRAAATTDPQSDAPLLPVCTALVQLPHELLLGIFRYLNASSLHVLSFTSREVAALMAGADEQLSRGAVVASKGGHAIPQYPPPPARGCTVGVLKPRSTWAALYRALASRHIPGHYVGAHHFLTQERVAQWVSLSHLLSPDEIRLLNRHTAQCLASYPFLDRLRR